MSLVRFPSNVTELVLNNSGTLTPDGDGNFTVTQLEANVLCASWSRPRIHSTQTNGNAKVWAPGWYGTVVSYSVGAFTQTLGSDDVTTAYQSSARVTPLVTQGVTLIQ